MATKFNTFPQPPKPKAKPKPKSSDGGINLGAPPPPPVTKKSAQPPAFIAFVNKWSKKYPGLKQWAPQILQYAKEVNIDPVYFASVILTESGANQNIPNSKAGAIGIAQIMPLHIGESVDWDPSGRTKVTAQDLKNPVFALRYAAYHLRHDIGNYGYAGAYSQGYNPGWTPASGGTDPLSRIPKGYLPGVSTPGVSGAPGAGQPTGPAATPSKDPWVVVTSKGILKTVQAPTAPKNAVTDATGAAYTLSEWQRVQSGLDSIYLAYTGVRASAKAVAGYIKNPVSDYQIQQRLSNPSNNPRFYKSPIWLTHAPSYEAVYKGIFGNDANPNSKQARQWITYGVTHNLDQTAFQQYLRDQPNYSSSEEYKGNAAQFRAGYEQIYGTPDATGEQHIDLAVRKGWNGDQWLQYLRSQPEYTASGEFQKNVYDLFNRLGFIPGAPAPGTAGTNFGPMAPTPAPNPAATGSALTS